MKESEFAKLLVIVNGGIPLALLLWDGYWHHLGANPVEYAIHTTGMLTLVFLMLTLTVTPVRKITGWNYPSHFRRLLGLYAFFYCCLHFAIYFWLDRSLSASRLLADVTRRPFILIGMSGLLMMVPLAITSTSGMIKRLGAKRWKRLHQLIYPTAIAGVIHYWMSVKADIRKPFAFAVALAILLGYRLIADYVPTFRRKQARA